MHAYKNTIPIHCQLDTEMIKETKKSHFMFQSLTVLNAFSVLKNTVYKCYNQIFRKQL